MAGPPIFSHNIPQASTVDEILGNRQIAPGVWETVRIARSLITGGASEADVNAVAARATALEGKALNGTGLASATGTLGGSPTIDVPIADLETMIAGLDNERAATALGVRAAIDARLAGIPLPQFLDVPGVSVAMTDSQGNRTFLESNDIDGAPTPPAVSLFRKGLLRASSALYVCNGDSMTQGGHGYVGSWPLMAEQATGKPFINLGHSGETAIEIAIRAGGVVPLLTFAGGTLPADTSSVTVTTNLTAPLSSSVQPDRNYDVTIRGVPATLHYDTGTTVWSISRKTAGTAVLINPSCPIPAPAVAPYLYNINVIWAGRNDAPRDAPSFAALDGMITRLERLGTPFIVISVTNTISETAGSAGYNSVTAFNGLLAARAPHAYVDLRGRLIREGLALAAISPTSDDTAAIANDCIPPSLSYDGLHLNQAGDQVAALIIQSELEQRGYL